MNIRNKLIQFAEAIESEHPQAAAVLLFSLAPKEAGLVLRELPTGLAIELAERIINTGEVSREFLQKLYENAGLSDFNPQNLEKEKMGLLLEILPHSGYLRQREIILGLEDLFSISLEYKEIRMIEDLQKVDEGRLGEALAGAEQNDITMALRVAGEEARKKILSSLDPDISSEIYSDLDWGGAILMADVEAASERLLSNIKKKL